VTELPFDLGAPPGILLDDLADRSGRNRAAVLADTHRLYSDRLT
jgi:hypothetical protein